MRDMNHNFLFALLVVCCVPLSGCIQTPLQVKQEAPMLIKNATDSVNISVADIPAMPQRAIESFVIPLPTIDKTKLDDTQLKALEEIEKYLD